jgi:hypothetical protein
MTIATQTSKAGPYVADGVQTRYPYAFPVTDLSHVKVYVDGVEVSTGVSIGDGEVVFSKAPAEGSSVGILRVVPITQETDLQNNTAFYPEIMEGAYDKLTMICQQLQEESSRSLKVPPGTENEGTLIGAITRIEVLAEQAQTTLVEITEQLERGKQLGNYITVNSVDSEGRLVCDKDSLPTALTTNTGAIYPLEKGSLVETDTAYLIDTKPYLSYMNEESFTGPWLVWRTGGPAGRPEDNFLRLSGGTIAGDLEVQGALTLNGEPFKQTAGIPTGMVFAYPGSVPPEGAYLLNGQTIANCSTLYPDFWAWVHSAGVRIISNDTYESELASAGVCGGFVVNSSTGSVRLPSATQGTLWGADSSNIGQSLAAGLPNIEGRAWNIGGKSTTDYSGALYAETLSGLAIPSGTGAGGGWVDFDASRSNPIYGNSDTVQPPAIRVSRCIQVFNATTALSGQESAQLASQMQMKAQTDFGNVAENLDFVVEYWDSGDGEYGWYRKYRSGWIEQGGKSRSNNGHHYITLFVPFSGGHYHAAATPWRTGDIAGEVVSCYANTDSYTVLHVYADGYPSPIDYNNAITWYACGY